MQVWALIGHRVNIHIQLNYKDKKLKKRQEQEKQATLRLLKAYASPGCKNIKDFHNSTLNRNKYAQLQILFDISYFFYRLFIMERKGKPQNTMAQATVQGLQLSNLSTLGLYASFLEVSETLSNTKSDTNHTLMFLQTVNNIAYLKLTSKRSTFFLKGTIKRVRHSSEMTFSGRSDYFWITKTELCVLFIHAISLQY